MLLELIYPHRSLAERISLVVTMDTSPTALFDSYEQEYWQFIDTIRTKLEDSVNDHKGGAGEDYHIIL